MSQTRAELEQAIVSKRRERVLYVSPEGIARCHAQIDALLDAWEEADAKETAGSMAGIQEP